MKKKILIYIDSDYQVRNYFTYDSLDIDGHETVVYANSSVSQKHILRFIKNFKGYIYVDEPMMINLRRRELNIIMMKNLSRSKTFAFKLQRCDRKSRVYHRLLSTPIISDILLFLIRAYLGENKRVRSLLLEENPDLVIIPSVVMGASFIDFLVSCEKLNIKTLFLIDNWDNLSSKTVFPILPTYLTVWGEQSKEHAVKIHNFPAENVFCIGTPRFDPYFLTKETKRPYAFDYVVFTGQSLPFDEISALKLLDHYMTKQNIRDIKIVYRPHPWRSVCKSFDYFLEGDYKNIIIDKQIKDYYYYSKTKFYNPREVNPSLEYYPDLLKNALFTISPLTTMIIEAVLVNKYVLVLTYNDGYHLESPGNALKYCEHFVGIEKIHAFKFCHNFDDLPELFSLLLNKTRGKEGSEDLRQDAKFIIEIPSEKYRFRLKKVVDEIFQRS